MDFQYTGTGGTIQNVTLRFELSNIMESSFDDIEPDADAFFQAIIDNLSNMPTITDFTVTGVYGARSRLYGSECEPTA